MKNKQKNILNKNNLLKFIINYLVFSILFIISLFLIYNQAVNGYSLSTFQHIQFIKNGVKLPHPLWHICVKIISYVFKIDLNISASLFTALLIVSYYFIILKIIKYILKLKDANYNLLIYSFVLLTIGPLYIPMFNQNLYLGQGSPSVWHIVTLFMVKPFALLAVFFIIKAYESNNTSHYLITFLIAILSIVAKPNFIMIFLPALIIFMAVKNRYDKKYFIFLISIILSSCLILLYQFHGTRFGGNIIFDFLGVWSLYSPNVLISIMLGLTFPLLFLILCYKYVKDNDYLIFSWILMLLGIILFAFYAENNSYSYRCANFMWSYLIAMSMLYIFTFIEYIKQYNKLSSFVKYSLLILISIQEITGLYYVINILCGGSWK